MINYSEALQECERMKKVTSREVEVKATECDCDYSKLCYVCAGSGTFYELVYAFCGHEVGDGTGEECESERCIERSAEAAMKAAVPFSGIEKPLLSLSEAQSERDAEAA